MAPSVESPPVMKNTAKLNDSGPVIPKVWLMMGHKAGDNNQLLALADALGWPYEAKQLSYRRSELLSNLVCPPTLAGIRRRRSSPLSAPWPDLVLTAGRRNEPVARWICSQTRGTTRLVHIGRPWAKPQRFDLVISTPQYLVPAAPNVLLNSLPLHRVTADRLEQSAASLAPQLAGLPRPYLAVLVGGDSGPYAFDRRRAACLAGEAALMARVAGGSLLITSSARTPTDTVDELQQQIAAIPHHLHRWKPRDDDNPYFGYLGLADAFIVTGESVSMLTEACETGKPVYIFDPGQHPLPLHCHGADREASLVDRRRWWQRPASFRWKPLTHRLAQLLGPRRMRRDVGVMHRHLVDTGRAVWLGDSHPETAERVPVSDLDRAVSRVRALF